MTTDEGHVVYPVMHFFLVSGRTFTFHEATIVSDNESMITFDYVARSDGIPKRATFDKDKLAGYSTGGGAE